MPELPEVENTVRDLKPLLVGLNVGDEPAGEALDGLCDYRHRHTTVAANAAPASTRITTT